MKTRRQKVVVAIVAAIVLVSLIVAAAIDPRGGGSAVAVGVGAPNVSATDFATQQATYRLMSEMNAMQHQTNMTIIHNMGNGACVIGQDPNCQ